MSWLVVCLLRKLVIFTPVVTFTLFPGWPHTNLVSHVTKPFNSILIQFGSLATSFKDFNPAWLFSKFKTKKNLSGGHS